MFHFPDNRNCDWGGEIENICQAVHGEGWWWEQCKAIDLKMGLGSPQNYINWIRKVSSSD